MSKEDVTGDRVIRRKKKSDEAIIVKEGETLEDARKRGGLKRTLGRRKILYEYNGECLSRSEWAKRCGISESTLGLRLKQGWSIGEALTTEVRQVLLYEYKGEQKNAHEWANEYGIPYKTLKKRLETMEIGEALTYRPKPAGRRNVPIEFNGKKQKLSEWAKEIGVSYPTLADRIRRGVSIETALTMEKGQRSKLPTSKKSILFAYSHGFITEGAAIAALRVGDRLEFRDRWIQFLKENPEVAKATGHDNYLD